MANIRPNAEPAATTVAVGDIFLIDGATGVRALAASVVPLIDASGNVAINNVVQGIASIATAAGTTILSANSAKTQYFTGTTTQTLQLPVTSTLYLNHTFVVENASTGAITVNSSGGNLITAVAPGATVTVGVSFSNGNVANATISQVSIVGNQIWATTQAILVNSNGTAQWLDTMSIVGNALMVNGGATKTAVNIDNVRNAVITGNALSLSGGGSTSTGFNLGAHTTNMNVQANTYDPAYTSKVNNSGTGNSIGVATP
jgi:hypothetical protein